MSEKIISEVDKKQTKVIENLKTTDKKDQNKEPNKKSREIDWL